MSDQSHGKRFEDFIKSCGLFPGSADQGRSPTSDFDIEAKFDRAKKLPTSIKSTGTNLVALSDARRFFETNGPYRMIVGRYVQVGDRKEFREIHEIVLSADCLARLKGELRAGDVSAFHDGLLIGKFPTGQHVQARAWARQRKRELAHRRTSIILNPKIGSDSQRRLQCSVRLTDLADIADQLGVLTVHHEMIGNMILPIIQHSPRRRFT